MSLSYYILLSIGTLGVTEPIIYMLTEWQYKKNPELEKSSWFEVRSVIFRFKYAKAVYIAVGVICLVAAVRIKNYQL